MQKSSTLYYFKTKESITVYFKDGSSASWDREDPEYERISKLALDEGYIAIRKLHDPIKGDEYAEGVNPKIEEAIEQVKKSVEVVNVTHTAKGEVKIEPVKKEPKKPQKSEKYKDRIEETMALLKENHNDRNVVAAIMGISLSTIKRNISKYKARNK